MTSRRSACTTFSWLRYGSLALTVVTSGCKAVVNGLASPSVAIVAATSDGVPPGGTASVPIIIARQGGYTGPVTVTCSVIGESGFHTTPVTVAADEGSATMLISVPDTATAGDRAITFGVSGTGLTAQLGGSSTIHVVPPSSFAVTINQLDNFQAMQEGGSLSIPVTVLRSNFTGAIALSMTGGSGITATFVPATLTGSATTAVMQLQAADNLPDAGQILTIHATSGATDRTVEFDTAIWGRWLQFQGSFPLTVAQGQTGGVSETVGSISQQEAPGPIRLSVTLLPNAFPVSVTPAIIQDVLGQFTLNASPTASTPVGDYVATVRASATGSTDATETITIHVVPPSALTLTVQTAPLNVNLGASQPDNVTLGRTNLTTGVTVSAATDDPGLRVIVTPATATTANSVALNVIAGNSASVGTHTVTLTGKSSLPDVQQTFAVVTAHATDGSQTPVGLILVPDSSSSTTSISRGGTVVYTAYLVDAQGNRTLPAAGWNIGIATTASNVAGIQTLAAYDNTQRWRKATVLAGQVINSTAVTAFYFNTTTGTSTLTAASQITVTQ